MFNAVTQQIESVAQELPSGVLLGTGIACALAGLVIWLAGLGMSRLAAAAVGGFAGWFIGYLFVTKSVETLALSAFIGAIVGLVVEVLLAYSLGYAAFGYNLIIALLTAASGSVLILLGMIFLLYLKGADSVNRVNANQKFYLTLFFAMIVFGAFEQLVFCRKKTTPSSRKKHAIPKTEIEPAEKSSWRNK